MSAFVERTSQGVSVVRLEGEVGAGEASQVETALAQALGAAPGRVLLDLRPTDHLHYRVAGRVARFLGARLWGRRLGIVGPTPYVRQILCLAGAIDADVTEYDDLAQALADGPA